MTDDTANLVLEHLRAIRGDVQEMCNEQREQRIRLGGIERTLASNQTELAEMSLRLDRMHDRIERRLGLVEV